LIIRHRRKMFSSKEQQGFTADGGETYHSGDGEDNKPRELGSTNTVLATAAAIPELPNHLAHNTFTGNLPVEIPADNMYVPAPLSRESTTPVSPITAMDSHEEVETPPPWSPDSICGYRSPRALSQQPHPTSAPSQFSQPPPSQGGNESEAEETEMEALRQKQAKLDAKRQRLRQLQRLDEEEEAIRQRISQLEKSSSHTLGTT